MQEITTEQKIATGQAIRYVEGGEGYDPDLAIASARACLQMIERAGMDLSIHLLALKTREAHGRYLSALRQIGVTQRTACRLVTRAAWLLKQAPASKGPVQQALIEMSGAALDVVIKAGPSALDAKKGEIFGQPALKAAKLSANKLKRVAASAGGGSAPVPAKAPATPTAAEVVKVVRRMSKIELAKMLRVLRIDGLIEGTGLRIEEGE